MLTIEQSCTLHEAALAHAMSTAAANGFLVLVNEYRREHYTFNNVDEETDAMNAMTALANAAETLRTEGEKLQNVVQEIVIDDAAEEERAKHGETPS